MFEVFFDGDCPLCKREIDMLRKLDRRGRLRFTDIAAPEFDPDSTGLSQAELMASIRGRMPSGELVEGVEVFRQLYGAVGFGFLIPLTRLPGIQHTLDAAYGVFARHRLRLTGRGAGGSCVNGSCAVPESA